MGFAKYHEDNMEMWEERNRARICYSVNQPKQPQSKNSMSSNRNQYIGNHYSKRNNIVIIQKGI